MDDPVATESKSPPRRSRMLLALVIAIVVAGGLHLWSERSRRPGDSVLLTARGETAAVGSKGDAADDPAIWVHPDDPELSLILGTDKKGGLHVYDLDGEELQRFEQADQNNVDLRHGFDFGDGVETLVAASAYRDAHRVILYRLDKADRRVKQLKGGFIDVTVDAKGICLYRSAKNGDFYFFVTGDDAADLQPGDPDDADDGWVEQWRVRHDATAGKPVAELVRRFDVGGRIEGCAADDDLGYFYVSEEKVGVWRYPAEPGDETPRELVDAVQPTGRLYEHVEGIAVYERAEGHGYLVISSQGSDDFCVYDRAPPHTYLGRFGVIAGNGIDAVTHTDGIEVTAASFGSRFPRGLFVAQDDENDGKRQNFKLVCVDDILSALKLDA
jgi:3-phytase